MNEPEPDLLAARVDSPGAVAAVRAALLVAARRLGIAAPRRSAVALAGSRLARRLLAAGGGEVRVKVGAGSVEMLVEGPCEALESAISNGLDRLVDRVELGGEGGATRLRLVITGEAASSGDEESGGGAASARNAVPAGDAAPSGDAAPAAEGAAESLPRDLAAALAVIDDETAELLARLGTQTRLYDRLSRELEDTNRGVVALYAELDERDQRKNEFLATLAHELRNPMSVIATTLHTVRSRGSVAADDQPLLAIAERQLRHLSRLVDDLLDVSRIDQNKITLRREGVDLATVVERAVETRRTAIDKRSHELLVELAPEPMPLFADPTRIEQVIDNLLTNAAKYTPEGGRIELAARREGEEAVLTVTDNGIGIPPNMLDRIFSLFAQADQSLDKSGGGLGLGLTLVDRLVEMHGGQVTAESEGEGRGSRFTVRLPLAADAEAETAAASPPGEPEAAAAERTRRATKPAVLIVEDNEDAREMLALLLEGRGFQVGTAADGREGVEKGSSGEWDVAIVDIGLPGLDGYEVARRLRASDGGGDLRLIALSGYGRPEDRARSAEAGFDKHLIKPVEPSVLFELLEQA